jgi:hypothetical protein
MIFPDHACSSPYPDVANRGAFLFVSGVILYWQCPEVAITSVIVGHAKCRWFMALTLLPCSGGALHYLSGVSLV